METQIAGSIARRDGSTSQDAIFKDVLAYIEVLAHIMKTCVPEYKDCTIPQIKGYIEPNPQKRQEEQAQKATDEFIKNIDKVIADKEKEIMMV